MKTKSTPRRILAAIAGFIVGIVAAVIAIVYLPFHFAADGWRQQ